MTLPALRPTLAAVLRARLDVVRDQRERAAAAGCDVSLEDRHIAELEARLARVREVCCG